MLKWVLIGVLVLIVIVAILFLVGLFLSVYYSIPYDEWVEKQKKTEGQKINLKPVDDGIAGRMRYQITEKQGAGICFKEGKELTVGRREGSSIYLPFDVISQKHAVFLYEDSKLWLMDLSSKNGTYLNGKKISAYAKTQCRENDVVTFADISCQIRFTKIVNKLTENEFPNTL